MDHCGWQSYYIVIISALAKQDFTFVLTLIAKANTPQYNTSLVSQASLIKPYPIFKVLKLNLLKLQAKDTA